VSNLSKLGYENDVIINDLHNPKKNKKRPCVMHSNDCRPKINELEGIPQEDEMDYKKFTSLGFDHVKSNVTIIVKNKCRLDFRNGQPNHSENGVFSSLVTQECRSNEDQC